MTTNHERFLAHLAASHEAVWKVARWLHTRGVPVKVNVSAAAPSADQWKKYTDQGDLEVSMRVEVKNLSAEFTCREDWPYGDYFMVCARHSYDLARPKPYAFIYLSGNGRALAIIKSASKPRWIVKEKADKRYKGVVQEFYFAPIDDVVFSAFNHQPQEAQ